MKRARVAPTRTRCEYSTGRPVAHASGLRSRLVKRQSGGLHHRQSGGLRYGLALPACEEGNPEDCTTGLRFRLAKTAIRRIAPRACASGLRRRQSGGLHHGLAFPPCEEGNPEDCTTALRFRLAKTAIRRIALPACATPANIANPGRFTHNAPTQTTRERRFLWPTSHWTAATPRSTTRCGSLRLFGSPRLSGTPSPSAGPSLYGAIAGATGTPASPSTPTVPCVSAARATPCRATTCPASSPSSRKCSTSSSIRPT